MAKIEYTIEFGILYGAVWPQSVGDESVESFVERGFGGRWGERNGESERRNGGEKAEIPPCCL